MLRNSQAGLQSVRTGSPPPAPGRRRQRTLTPHYGRLARDQWPSSVFEFSPLVTQTVLWTFPHSTSILRVNSLSCRRAKHRLKVENSAKVRRREFLMDQNTDDGKQLHKQERAWNTCVIRLTVTTAVKCKRYRRKNRNIAEVTPNCINTLHSQ